MTHEQVSANNFLSLSPLRRDSAEHEGLSDDSYRFKPHGGKSRTPLIVRSPADINGLSERVEAALNSRLAAAQELSLSEIESVEKLDKRLFPTDFEISEGARETLRYLCMFSQTELRPSSKITSHRRFIGPVIVFLKRLSWPLIEIHLRDTFRSLQEFNTRAVEAQAGAILRNELLAKEIRRLSEKLGSQPFEQSSTIC